jgi:hypothetical protein
MSTRVTQAQDDFTQKLQFREDKQQLQAVLVDCSSNVDQPTKMKTTTTQASANQACIFHEQLTSKTRYERSNKPEARFCILHRKKDSAQKNIGKKIPRKDTGRNH